ncbi:hypothetical protein MSPP1_002066 [Malassezia sp. CBS 17886]|nr:hypothetical protein MSPP1_002066 [Malassezia sp. CBS 17886]
MASAVGGNMRTAHDGGDAPPHGDLWKAPSADPHLDLHIPWPQAAATAAAGASAQQVSLLRMDLVIQLASLHRAAEVARYHWRQGPADALPTTESGVPPAAAPAGASGAPSLPRARAVQGAPPRERQDAPSREQQGMGWDRLLADLATRIQMVVAIHGMDRQAPDAPADDNAHARNGTRHSRQNLSLHLPHQSWAQRYPGAAGEWLRRELSQRSSSRVNNAAALQRRRMEMNAQRRAAGVAPLQPSPAHDLGQERSPSAARTSIIPAGPSGAVPWSQFVRELDSSLHTPAEDSGAHPWPRNERTPTQLGAGGRSSAQDPPTRARTGMRAAADGARDGVAETPETAHPPVRTRTLADPSLWRRAHAESPRSTAQRLPGAPSERTDEEPVHGRLVRQVRQTTHWQGSVAERDLEQHLESVERQLTAPLVAPLSRDARPDTAPLPPDPLHEWVDFQGITRGIAFLQRGPLRDVELLMRLLAAATSPLGSADGESMRIYLALPSLQDRGAGAASGGLIPDLAANVLLNDHSCWRADHDDLLILELRGLMCSCCGGSSRVYAGLAMDDPLRVAEQAWERALGAPCAWLRATDKNATNQERLLRHLAEHEALSACRLRHVGYADEQRRAIAQCRAVAEQQPQSVAAIARAAPLVDRLVDARAQDYLRVVRARAARTHVPDPSPVITLTRLNISLPPWGDGADLRALIFISLTPFIPDGLRYYDQVTENDVHALARRHKLRGPGLKPHLDVAASDAFQRRLDTDTPLYLPSAYVNMSHASSASPHVLDVPFQTVDGRSATVGGARLGRHVAIKVLRGSRSTINGPVEIQHVYAEGHAGRCTSAQGGWCDTRGRT